MAVEVTESFEGFSQSYQEPWRGRRVFEVTGTDKPLNAVDEVGNRDRENKPCRIPQAGEAFLSTSPLECEGPYISGNRGPGHFIVACDYSINSLGGATTVANVLALPPKFRWENIQVSEQSDIDLDGRPVLNAAGSLFQGHTRTVTMKRLTVTKWLPAPYDVTLAATYENAVNQNALTLGGVPILAEHVRCDSVLPIDEYDTNAKKLHMAFVFEVVLVVPGTTPPLGLYPFQARYPNVGTEGWYDDSGTKRSSKFTDGKGNELGRSVRLAQDGTPHAIETSNSVAIKVGPNNSSPIANPNVVNPYKYTQLTVNGAAVVDAMYYKRVRLVDFANLAKIFQI